MRKGYLEFCRLGVRKKKQTAGAAEASVPNDRMWKCLGGLSRRIPAWTPGGWQEKWGRPVGH